MLTRARVVTRLARTTGAHIKGSTRLIAQTNSTSVVAEVTKPELRTLDLLRLKSSATRNETKNGIRAGLKEVEPEVSARVDGAQLSFHTVLGFGLANSFIGGMFGIWFSWNWFGLVRTPPEEPPKMDMNQLVFYERLGVDSEKLIGREDALILLDSLLLREMRESLRKPHSPD